MTWCASRDETMFLSNGSRFPMILVNLFFFRKNSHSHHRISHYNKNYASVESAHAHVDHLSCTVFFWTSSYTVAIAMTLIRRNLYIHIRVEIHTRTDKQEDLKYLNLHSAKWWPSPNLLVYSDETLVPDDRLDCLICSRSCSRMLEISFSFVFNTWISSFCRSMVIFCSLIVDSYWLKSVCICSLDIWTSFVVESIF